MVCDKLGFFEQLEAKFFFFFFWNIIISQSYTRYATLFMPRFQNIEPFIYYVEILAYACVYCLCIGPCFYDVLSVAPKTFV